MRERVFFPLPALMAWAVLCGLFVATGCTFVVADDERLSVLSWNIENLFDAIDQGSEYPEFTSQGGWTERDYQRRKQRIAEAIHAFRPRPDVMVFIEIENAGVLDDLLDKYVVDISAPYRAFAAGPGGAIGIGVGSRYPITAVRTHLPRSGEFPPLRPVLEVHLDIAGEPLAIFANHWKSKRGGAPATEPLRRATALLLAARLAQLSEEDPELPVLVLGDFNERPREFELTGMSYPTAIMPAREVERLYRSAPDDRPSWATEQWFSHPDHILIAPDAVAAQGHRSWAAVPVLVNLWDSIDASGSYYFINRWERIDSIFPSVHFFEPGGLEYDTLAVPCPRDGCDSFGRPLSWEDDPRGVSDHLPLLLTLRRAAAPQ